MRSERRESLIGALAQGNPATVRWTSLSNDPNSPEALLSRAAVLRRAWRPAINDRIKFLEERCRGKRLLDIGCVDHFADRVDSQDWLHGRLAAVAESSVGVDIEAEGVQLMNDRGFEAIQWDLSDGPGPLSGLQPFDVVVAGELFEHVENFGLLFETAAGLMRPGGELIITTPNPYAPHRVWAGRRGIVWENVDHVTYAFPSGIAELCDRHGLVLSMAATTADSRRFGLKAVLGSVKRALTGGRWFIGGFTSVGPPGVAGVKSYPMWVSVSTDLSGETSIYVVRKPVKDAQA